METRQRISLVGISLGLGALASVIAWPDVPDQMVTHWNAAGDPDGTLPKAIGLVLLPAVAASTAGLLALLPRVDPLREILAEFGAEYDWFVVVLTAFLVLLHGGLIAFDVGVEFRFLSLVVVGVTPLDYYVGYLLDHAGRTGSSASGPPGRWRVSPSGSERTTSAAVCSRRPRSSR